MHRAFEMRNMAQLVAGIPLGLYKLRGVQVGE